MDYRHLLLLHLPIGLKISAEDFAGLFAPPIDAGDIQQVLRALVSDSARIYIDKHPDWVDEAARILDVSAKHSVKWIDFAHQDYPKAWQRLSVRLPIFSYRGEPVWKKMPLLSVVGSRTPAPDTLLWLQRELGAFLKKRELAVVSGGARGIDQWAHRIALDSRRPTICIFPSGILNPYPFQQEALWERIVDEGGCLVSTCGLSEPMRKSFFHIRNRWIAGLSSVCLVAEANRRSGSLLTAAYVLEEQRTLCTLPVSANASQGLGNLDLMANGALFLRDANDLDILFTGAELSCPASFENLQREG